MKVVITEEYLNKVGYKIGIIELSKSILSIDISLDMLEACSSKAAVITI